MRQDWRTVALFVGSILILGVIVGGPLIYAIKLSFYATASLVGAPHWVGLKNYGVVLGDPAFWNAFANGLEIALSAIVLQVVLGICIALVLNRRFRGRELVRSLSVLPYFLPAVVACLVAKWLLDPNYGLVKAILTAHGFRMFDWGANAATAKSMIVLVSVWIWTPFVTTCVLAGLQTIPQQLYEAARVDGANAWEQFWHVTLPGLRSILIIVILLRGIWMFNKFDVIWLMTGGGPLNGTETLPILAYRRAFLEFNLGTGSAVATISFMILAVIILAYLWIFPIEERKQGR
jgi:multiple sugar transport system permease protein